MLRLHVRLPFDRYLAGEFWIMRDGRTVHGPIRCRGEADNRNAAEKDNVTEDPTKVGGDHPGGVYRVGLFVPIDQTDARQRDRYGPYFIRLDPIAGEALEAKQIGRTGLGIHGGRLHPDGRLRETYGCLRLDDVDVMATVLLVKELRYAEPDSDILYECQIEAEAT